MNYREFREKILKEMDDKLDGYDSETFEDWAVDLQGLIEDMLEEE